MMTGDSYTIPIKITTPLGIANKDTFSDVEIMFGNVRKTLANGDIKYDEERQFFLIPFTQKETFRFGQNTDMQIRVKFMDGSVIGIPIKKYDFEKSMSKVVL